MITIRGRDDLHRIVVLNPKGGCGKTTLVTNLGSALAARGSTPTLIDCDPQGYVSSWVERRPSTSPEIYGMHCGDHEPVPIEFEVPPVSDTVIVDLPANIPLRSLYDYTYMADSLLIPIQPSDIDVHSATRFIAELLLDAQLDRSQERVAIVANRVRARTRSYVRLMRFLTSLRIPVIATLRDSQNFVQAAAAGLGVCELPSYVARQDVPEIERILRWIDRRRKIPAQADSDEIGRVAPADLRQEQRPAEHGDPQGGRPGAEASIPGIRSTR